MLPAFQLVPLGSISVCLGLSGDPLEYVGVCRRLLGSIRVRCCHCSLGFSWVQFGSFGFSLDSFGQFKFSLVHLDSLGFTWVLLVHLGSLGLTWFHLGSLGFI